ncbi:MAG: glycosyltransferase [Anaerolineae bacterium]|nr:glycosyltransferase [Anaerolineae bacterium]
MNLKRILLAGSFKYDFYEAALAQAFERLGHEVIKFRWEPFYGEGLIARLRKRWLIGRAFQHLGEAFVRCGYDTRPDVIFVQRGVVFGPSILRKIKDRVQAPLVSYNNDDPFGHQAQMRLWRNFVACIPLYDLHFVYRNINVSEYYEHGAQRVEVLLPYYIPELHYPIDLTPQQQDELATDVIFVGNPQDKERVRYFDALVTAGIKLKVYGMGWQHYLRLHPELEGAIYPAVWGIDYTYAMRAAKLALALFSKTNRDTYSRRAFEIPAIGTCMVSQRTTDMQGFFREDVEAAYFSNFEELVDKVQQLLQDDARRCQLAHQARTRVTTIGASVDDRVRQILSAVDTLI